MRCAILAIGNEVLFGDIVNTNGGYLARRIREIGGDVVAQVVYPDRQPEIVAGIRRAFETADVVLLVGGLGPTDDDLTREALAEAVGRRTVTDAAALRSIEAFFSERGVRMPPANRRQALIPEGGTMLANRRGTAPGIFLDLGAKAAACLPGPPIETEEVFEEGLLPFLKERVRQVRRVVWLRFAGIGESALVERLQEYMGDGNPSLLPYAKRGEVHLRLAAEGETEEDVEAQIAKRRQEVEERVGTYLYGVGQASFERVILDGLRSRKETVATQESATGGWLAHRLTDPAGASEVFLGGSVVYTPVAKTVIGGLDDEDLKAFGTVSPRTAERLAEEIRCRLGSTWGLATCGWAGPTGDGPIGTGYIALAGPEGTTSEEVRAWGLREDVRFRLTQSALVLLWTRTRSQ